MIRSILPLTLLLAVAVGYPLGVLAQGTPHFPKRTECVDIATRDGDLEAIFGRFDRTADAARRLRSVTAAGFKEVRIESDGCGRLKIVLHGIHQIAVGRELAAEAKSVGFTITIEDAAL